MKAWVLKRLGGPLELVDLPEPEAEEGEVVLRVEAVGLNFADHLMRLGAYLTRLHPPFIPGMEVVGVVVFFKQPKLYLQEHHQFQSLWEHKQPQDNKI